MSLEIVLGPMFSGKSSYAISYIRRHLAIGKHVVAIKPNIDNRYTEESVIVTHDKEQIPCILWNIDDPLSFTTSVVMADCIVIEEAQFLKGLESFVNILIRSKRKQILIVGLDGDSNQQKFGDILECIPLADTVRKLNAFCHICKDGTQAPYTKKIIEDGCQDQVNVGSHDKYAAVCLKHLCD
jgi:thymidine kinase